MALVRRGAVVGQQSAGQVLAAAVSQVPPQVVGQAIGHAPVPGQAPGAPGHAGGPGQGHPGGPGQPGGPVGPGAPGQPGYPGRPPYATPVGSDGAAVAAVAAGSVGVPGATDAAAVPSMPASGLAVLLSFGLVFVGGFAAYEMGVWHDASTFRVGNEMSAFGALFVFAAAVERLLEPLSQWLPGRSAKGDYERMIAAVANRHPTAG